ncbi:MAG: hypothetical protein U0694_19535 [Anaerolineae bacterium]
MNEEAATQYVIRELGKHHHKNDIIEKLCTNYEMGWREAQAFVSKVEKEHAGKINLRQSPLYIFVGLVILLGGIGLSTWVGMETFINHTDMILFSMPFPYSGNILYGTAGIGMIIGGLIGMVTPLAKRK